MYVCVGVPQSYENPKTDQNREFSYLLDKETINT